MKRSKGKSISPSKLKRMLAENETLLSSTGKTIPLILNKEACCKSRVQNDTFSIHPYEIKSLIFNHLDPESLLTASRVCFEWYLLSHCDLLWRRKCYKLYHGKRHRGRLPNGGYALDPSFDYNCVLETLKDVEIATLLVQIGIRSKEVKDPRKTYASLQFRDGRVCGSKWKASYYASIIDSQRIHVTDGELVSYDWWYIDRWQAFQAQDDEDSDPEMDPDQIELAEIAGREDEAALQIQTYLGRRRGPQGRVKMKFPVVRFFENRQRGPIGEGVTRPHPASWCITDGHLQVSEYPPHNTVRTDAWVFFLYSRVGRCRMDGLCIVLLIEKTFDLFFFF